MMRRFWSALRQFGSDETGATGFIVLFGLIPITVLVLIIANSAGGLQDKTRAQDAADSLSLLHATMSARSLNVMSMNNVTLTQVTSVGIASNALEVQATILKGRAVVAIGQITAHGLTECKKYAKIPYVGPFIAGYCAVDHGLMTLEAFKAISDMRKMQRRYNPRHGLETATNAILAINAMNRALIDRHPEYVRQAMRESARENRIADFYTDSACETGNAESCRGDRSGQGMDLPVEKGGATTRAEFCLAMKTGGFETPAASFHTTFLARGFGPGEGPFDNGGDNQHPALKDFVSHQSGFGRSAERYYEYYKDRQMFCALTVVNLFGRILRKIGFKVKTSGACPTVDQVVANYNFKQSTEENDLKRQIRAAYLGFCAGGSEESVGGIGGLLIGVPSVDHYRPVQPAGFARTGPVHASEIVDEFKVAVLTFRKRYARFASSTLEEPTEGSYSYAQSLIYNPDGIDLYSQNFQARLMPSTRLDDLRGMIDRMQRRAPESFSALRHSLENVQDAAGWLLVNVK